MSDLIKREDAIDAIEGTDWYHQNRNKDMVSGANSDEHQAWYKAEDVYKALKEVPSAEITHDDVMQYCNSRLLVLATVESINHQYRIGFEDGKASADRPQGEWIPTSVRTPKDNRAVLVYEKNYRNIYTAYYHSVYGWMTFDPYSNECFDEHLDIIAWMPLPERWKGADDE